MKHRGIAIGFGSIVATGATAVAILGTSVVCGCAPEGWSVISALSANPMKDPLRARTAFLAAVPKGAPLSQARELIGPSYYDRHCKEISGGALVTCSFDMEESYSGLFRNGFKFTIKVDGSKVIQDVEFQSFTRRT